MSITAEYDREADALYIRLAEGQRDHAVEIDEATYVDVAADGRPLGLEVLYPSMGTSIRKTAQRLSLEDRLLEIIAAVVQSGAPISDQTVTGGQYLASTSTVNVLIEGTVAAGRATFAESIGLADPVFCGVEG